MVDDTAAIYFQQATKVNAKLKGVYNLRDKQVQELRDDSDIATEDARTTFNSPDAPTKCLTAKSEPSCLRNLAGSLMAFGAAMRGI